MSVEVKCVYCGCACNKTPNAIDWGRNDIVCYSACNAVQLFHYEKAVSIWTHQETLIGHAKLVTSVHWIKKPNNEPEDELIVTSADHTASLWKLVNSKFVLSSSLVGHTNVIRNGSGLYAVDNKNRDLTLATVSSDSSIKIWTRNNRKCVSCVQTILMGNGFALDAKLASLKNDKEIVLVVSTDDANLHIYITDTQEQFVPAVKLVGHEDWIQSISILNGENYSDSGIKIATASQDCYIRIWKVSPKVCETEHCNEGNVVQLKVDETTFQTSTGNAYSVSLESVLSGHENWIYSVRWNCSQDESNSSCLQLLSASMDKTIIIWELDKNSNIWLEKVRFGEVGGNTLGFFGAVFSPTGESVLAHGHQGSIHMWHLLEESDDAWEPGVTVGGHHSSVKDIDWDPHGEYVLSCSSDQTTRLHAPFVNGSSKNCWYEIGRPQIHGFDMVCLTLLGRYKFVSAGDEKVLRAFEAPRSFADTLESLVKLDASEYLQKKVAEGASVPSLGLSNKAVFSEDIKYISVNEQNEEKHPKDRYPDFYYTPTHLKAPPTEETLLQNTLWPESQKLYGHPYEVFTVASNHARTLVASACKASKVEHAGIILWDTSSWRQVSYLSFHALTVTQIEFSPDDQYLLSASRDRMWALYRHTPEDPFMYIKVANLDKKTGVHTRIIWSCSWTFDSLYFATASRDKKVAVWGKSKEDANSFPLCLRPLEVEDSASAVAFAPTLIKNKYLMAIGLENGSIILSLWCPKAGWTILQQLDQNIAHHLNVNRLKFSPHCGEAGLTKKATDVLQLASCSDDHHTKIYNIYLLNEVI